MKLTIDNLDGLGAVDYSAAVDHSEKLTVVRGLNVPSTLKGMLSLAGSGLAVPVRRGRVIVSGDAGATLFTGYLTTEPVAEYAGVASEGEVYRLRLGAVSDEWLLDKQASGSAAGGGLGETGGSLIGALVQRAAATQGGARFVTTGVSNGHGVGVFDAGAGEAWSAVAGGVANATYAAYRVLNGAVNMAPAGSVTHALADGDARLQVAGVRTASVRELANDVTMSGEMEPAAYWQEIFEGDGTTVAFALTGEPGAWNGGRKTLLVEHFAGATIDAQRWVATDPGSHFGLGADGLLLTGGNGFDGQTTLAGYAAVELGGSLVLELAGVRLGAASAGVVGGLYAGVTAQANCFAGFNVRQAGGNTVVTALVSGAEVGTTATLLDGHAYTLRVRVHCAEMLRVKQVFYAMVDANGTMQVTQFGGGLVDAPASVVLEMRDEGASSNTPVTVLYDGVVPSAPAKATLVAVNSVQLFGAVGRVELRQTGSAWVRGVGATKLMGKAGEGVDCGVSANVTGSVTFMAGRVPTPGEYVTVLYRGRRRAVARVADAASLAAEAAGGGVGTARWLGHVVRPAARSSEDCENAAQAVLSFASDRAAAVAGSCVVVQSGFSTALGDIWPGDVLTLNTAGRAVSAVVRRVEVQDHGGGPEVLLYRVQFANDWAEGLGMHLSEAIAKDALLPVAALEPGVGQTVATMPHVLANLQQMTVAVVPGSGGAAGSLTVDAGVDPPIGGGFEVRRHDGGWGAGIAGTSSGELVLRSPVRGFSIPRGAFEERFFVRMYDGGTPRLYSRESSAVVTHIAL